MAEIIAPSKRTQIKLDLTPMVDLGFLLLTFFVLTTTLTKPATLQLAMPSEEPTPNPNIIPESCAITIIPCKNGYYTYLGSNAETNTKLIGLTEVRSQLSDLKKAINNKIQAGQLLPDAQAFVFIKPTSNSTYGQCIDVLDELLINNINLYSITQASDIEEAKIKTNR
jgi:biopolymer transport protein ExbD